MNEIILRVKNIFKRCKVLLLDCFASHESIEYDIQRSDNILNSRNHIIYHYCTVETFLKIIEFKKLWLSDAKSMNDAYETVWVDKVVNDILNSKQNNLNEGKIGKVKKIYKSFNLKKHYLCSFSKNRDLLSQWRAYGNDGSGIAIGFNIGLFPDILNIYSKSQGTVDEESSTHVLGYENVSYTHIFLEAYISKLLKDDSDLKAKVLIMKELATMMKHPSFKEESEVRLSYTPGNNLHDEADMSLEKLSKIKFRHSKNKIIPYFEFDFSSAHNSLIIPEIVLGPKCEIDKSKLALFLKSCGFNDTVVKSSESSYRGNQ